MGIDGWIICGVLDGSGFVFGMCCGKELWICDLFVFKDVCGVWWWEDLGGFGVG